MRLIFLEPMLEDKRQFDLSNIEGTHLISTVNSIATFPKIIGVIIGGVMLDLVGRRVMISFGIMVTGLALAYIPFASPSYETLYLSIIANEMFMAILEANPLNVDYAAK